MSLQYIAGRKIADCFEDIDYWESNGQRLCFYRCIECHNIQVYGHHEAEVNSDTLGKKLTEDTQCWECGSDADLMELISIYDDRREEV